MDKLKGAIFDLDGTLFDSLWVWEEIDLRFLSKRGIAVPPDYSQSIGALSFRQTAEYTVQRFKLAETPESLMQEWMEMSREAYANEIRLKKGAKEFLIRLKEMGVKLAVATSSTPDLYVPALINNGIYELFSAVVDTTTERSKDHPDIYLAAAKKLGVSPAECAVFEDLPVAVDSAKRGGFFTVAVYDDHYKGAKNGFDKADLFVYGYEELMQGEFLHKCGGR